MRTKHEAENGAASRAAADGARTRRRKSRRAGARRTALWAALLLATLAAAVPAGAWAGGVGRGGVGGGGEGAPPPVSAPPPATPAPATPSTPTTPTTPVLALARLWPVGVRPVVLRGWEPPASAYGPGHRGVDLAATPGDPVRAVAAGRVSFAGPVGGLGVVSVELTGTGAPPLRTTYESVRASVRKGDEVAPGDVVGFLAEPGPRHCASRCLHWGLRRGESYLDPLSLLPPWLLRRGPSRLLPVPDVP